MVFNFDSHLFQNLVALGKDLRDLKVDMIFWNWSISAAGVICRLDKDTIGDFYNGKTVAEVVEMFLGVKENVENV